MHMHNAVNEYKLAHIIFILIGLYLEQEIDRCKK